MSKALAFINPRLSTKNVGDFFIEDSVKRILAYDPARSTDVDPRQPVSAETIDAINRCDAAVIVGTNLWYRHLYKAGRWMFSLPDLERIRVPVIPMGLGTTRHGDEDNGFTPESQEILRWIHQHCEESSVRDPRTLEAVNGAGIQNVRMTGCPTLYRSLKADWELVAPKSTHRLVMTVRKGQHKNVRRLIKLLEKGGWELLIAAQQEKDTFLKKHIPLLQRSMPTLYEYDMQPYLAEVESSHGVIGWRLHGNMLHLAHGNPAVYFANCSRAASFCEAFHLPCVVAEDGEIIETDALHEAVRHLTDREGFRPFQDRYRHYRNEMIAFLEANGLDHHLGQTAA